MTYEIQADGRYHIPIVDLGNRLQNNFGLNVGEHSAFGGVAPVHAPNSYHKYDEALDITDWRDDDIDGVSWQERTGNLQNLLQGSGAEIIGPNSGDPNHSTHLHIAAKDGIFKLDQGQYDYLFGGNSGGKRSTFAYTPSDSDASTDVTPDSPTQTTPQQEAVERTQNYANMSKAELDAAYDGMRNDPAKAKVEGMKMHKAYFGKA